MKKYEVFQKVMGQMVPNNILLHVVISAVIGFFIGLIIQALSGAYNAPLLCAFGSTFFALYRRRLNRR
ncbi:MAG: hypothetical protein ACKO1F_12295 [Flammeovirgaceae bacterium]